MAPQNGMTRMVTLEVLGFLLKMSSVFLSTTPPPPLLGQTNQAAKLLAVQTALTTFRHQNIAIITGSDWVFKGATC